MAGRAGGERTVSTTETQATNIPPAEPVEATRAEYCVISCAGIFAGAGEIMASPMAPTPLLGARLARLTTEPDLLITDGEALILADTPADRQDRSHRGLDAVPQGVRRRGVGPSPCGHGRQPDRSSRKPEPVGVRTAAAPDAPDVRRPRRTRQHHQPPDELLGAASHGTRLREDRRHRVRHRIRQGRPPTTRRTTT